ncbi:hypothetical protein C8R47DRAFT_395405 [Mycena vitilis]|nr:hypothetical protein C8R47DRAFT_395405 [Mycena vitilis]
MAPGRGVELVSLKGGAERDAWVEAAGAIMGPWRLYGASKLGNIIISNYFARVHEDVLVSCALHPGFIATDLGRHGGTMMQITGNAFFNPVPLGAYTALWGATVAPAEEVNGQYLVPWGAVGKADARAADRGWWRSSVGLWRGSERCLLSARLVDVAAILISTPDTFASTTRVTVGRRRAW